VGLIAMVEIAALMIGDIVQCYSDVRYASPRSLTPGMFLKKGQPKSLYRPGSSTTVLLFQPMRIQFAQDLIENQRRPGVASRFSQGFSRPVVETEVTVRSAVALPASQSAASVMPRPDQSLSALRYGESPLMHPILLRRRRNMK